MTRLVSAEEARGLLADVSHTLPWRDYKYGILRSDDVPCSYVVSWDYAVSENDKGDAEQLFTEIIIKAPDLAATVIALSEERVQVLAIVNQYRHRLACNGWSWLPEGADMARAEVERLKAERDRLRATLYREGYAPCSSAACNCGGWHK